MDSIKLKQQDLLRYTRYATESAGIDPEMYSKYDVKRGLRDISGKGVLTGLTEISEIRSYIVENNDMIPCEGKLFYRGYNVEELVSGFLKDKRFGFEEATFLLLFGHLPDDGEYETFRQAISSLQKLPEGFVRDTILDSPSKDMMNALSKSVLTLYSYDSKADDTSIDNVILQSLRLIAQFPLLCVYAYQAHQRYHKNGSLIIHSPDSRLSIAENILRLLRPDRQYTELEARILDLALVLHAEHGGGNNSTFTTHVVTSSGTDTYSSTVASLGSLKGPRHGGANIKVVEMFEDLKERVEDWENEEQICAYLTRILEKDAFDKSGLIYGMGHAVYSISDPRAVILKSAAEELAQSKGLSEEFRLYARVERLAPQVIAGVRKIYKGVSANVDFYSGFVYRMLGIPTELFTPLFAISRISGWSAHRIEELVNAGKIIRPAYKSIAKRKPYTPMTER
ncbi:MAG: citrate/2-methylcitrate synthase [Clostridia bacterium]|nr:citrate/2-methylcitrate synthase [Clostridia bacterium]